MVRGRLLAPISSTREQDVRSLGIAAYVFFSLLDCFTTSVALTGGRAAERNPVAAQVYAAHGAVGLYALKGVVVAVIVAALLVLPRRISVWVAVGFTAAVALAVAANLQVIVYS